MIWLWMACAKVPTHLQVAPEAPNAGVNRAVRTVSEVVGLLARRDPLVRSPLLP
ncbi:MAG: hypothetical protein H0V89_08040, partial [Deltaproteobacteria bacterium]|nr:hypothetical protein [Deltaproteobacteria bacterium]